MKIVPIKLSVLSWAATCISIAAFLVSQPAAAQSLITGYWNPLLHQDAAPYAGGPDPGDFAGLPITEASRKVAQQYDPDRGIMPELQCQPFPATYGPRALSTMRMWETLDPESQEQTKIESWISFAAQHREIWMPASNHPYPPVSAPHSWQGYSTGKWVGNVLWVHTDHLKDGFLLRSVGLPLDDKTTMDERIFRYADVLVDIMMISDPQYLSQPFVYSKLYYRIPQGNMDPYPCTPHNQVELPEGHVPMHLPFYTTTYNRQFMSHGIPFEAARGGEQTMLPEYQDYLKTLPPNPPLSKIEEEQQQQIVEQSAISQEK